MKFNKESAVKITQKTLDREEFIDDICRKWFKHRLPRMIKRRAKNGYAYIAIYADTGFKTYSYLKELAEFAESLGFNTDIRVSCNTHLLIDWKEEEDNA